MVIILSQQQRRQSSDGTGAMHVQSMLLLWSRPEAAEIVVSAICYQKAA